MRHETVACRGAAAGLLVVSTFNAAAMILVVSNLAVWG
jgi:hypothetical protein